MNVQTSSPKLFKPLAWLAVAGLAIPGCGPLRPELPQASPEVTARADSAGIVRSELAAIGGFPSEEHMRPDVRLYTELVWIEDSGRDPRRDTLRTPTSVANWLENRRSRQAPDVLFELDTDEIYVCRDAVLQYGTYPLGVDPTGQRTFLGSRVVLSRGLQRHAFVARWIRTGSGLELEALWLSPVGGEARVARLGRGCRSASRATFAARYAVRRGGVDLGAGFTDQSQPIDAVEQALVAHGWEQDIRHGGAAGFSAQGTYRFRPGWQVAGVAGYQLPAYANGFAGQFRAELEWSGFTLGAVLVREVGPIRLAAGPAVAVMQWNWSDEVTASVFDPGEPTSATTVTPGGLAELGVIQALGSNLYVRIAGRYYLMGDARAPGFRDLESVDVSMSQARLTLGVGWWW